MCVFIIIMDIEGHLSLVPTFLVCLRSQVAWEQEGDNPRSARGEEIFPREMVQVFFYVITLHRFIRSAFIE